MELTYSSAEVLSLSSIIDSELLGLKSLIRADLSLTSTAEEYVIEAPSSICSQLKLKSLPSDSESGSKPSEEPIVVIVPYVRPNPEPVTVVRIRPIRISRYGS